MKIKIDNTQDVRTIDKDRVGQFISELNNELRGQGKLIERFESKGKAITFLEVEQNPGLLNDIEELNVFTKETAQVIREALDFSKVNLPKMVESLKTICTMARQDKVRDAINSYSSILPFFQMLVMALIGISDSINQEKFDYAPLNSSISELNDGLAKKDYVLFCDVLEYKLIPELDKLNISVQTAVIK
jgi:hypothetical protein